MFGDSLTQRSFEAGGWGAAIADKYVRKVRPAADGESNDGHTDGTVAST